MMKSLPSSSFLSMLMLLMLLQPIYSKQVSGRTQLTGANTEHTLVKFALSPHAMGQVRATIFSDKLYINERSLRIHVYTDADWPTVKKLPLCTDKIKYAKHTSSIYFSNRPTNVDKYGDPLPEKKQKKGYGKSYYRAEVVAPVDNSMATRPTYWYFTIDDCSLELYGHDSEIPMLEYTIRVMDDTSAYSKPGGVDKDFRRKNKVASRNEGFTHLPADEKGMKTLHWLNVLFSIILCALLGRKIYDSIQNRHDVHAAILIVMVSSLFNGLSSLCEIIHLTFYESNGIGSYTMDAFSAHFEASCDAMVAIVLLSVGCGWTLPSDVLTGGSAKLFAGLSNPVGSVDNLFRCGYVTTEPAGIMALTVLIMHALLAQWGRMYNDDFDTYHTLEHSPGRTLMIFRVVLGLIFVGGVASVRSGGRCPPPLMKFLTKFALVGLAWFVSLPFVSTFVMSTIPFYARHQAMSVGSTVLQNCSLASLAWLFTADSGASAYHRFSKIKEGGGLSDMGGGGGLGSAAGGASDGSSSSIRAPARSAKEWVFGKTKVRLD